MHAGGCACVLAALSSLVSKPGGAAALKEAVDQQPSGALTKLANAWVGPKCASRVPPFRPDIASRQRDDVSNFECNWPVCSHRQRHSSSIMGLLGSTVMAALGQQQRSQNLDASGWPSFSRRRTSNITQALPAGISKYLSGTGIFDGLSEADANVLCRILSLFLLLPATPWPRRPTRCNGVGCSLRWCCWGSEPGLAPILTTRYDKMRP